MLRREAVSAADVGNAGSELHGCHQCATVRSLLVRCLVFWAVLKQEDGEQCQQTFVQVSAEVVHSGGHHRMFVEALAELVDSGQHQKPMVQDALQLLLLLLYVLGPLVKPVPILLSQQCPTPSRLGHFANRGRTTFSPCTPRPAVGQKHARLVRCLLHTGMQAQADAAGARSIVFKRPHSIGSCTEGPGCCHAQPSRLRMRCNTPEQSALTTLNAHSPPSPRCISTRCTEINKTMQPRFRMGRHSVGQADAFPRTHPTRNPRSLRAGPALRSPSAAHREPQAVPCSGPRQSTSSLRVARRAGIEQQELRECGSARAGKAGVGGLKWGEERGLRYYWRAGRARTGRGSGGQAGGAGGRRGGRQSAGKQGAEKGCPASHMLAGAASM